jgi:hypothetical protein
MANLRCFDSFNTNLTASEGSDIKKKKAIFNEIQKNVYLYATANPVKQNGQRYNRNTKVNSSCTSTTTRGYVVSAESYELLNEVSEGAALNNPVQVHDDEPAIRETCSTACSNTFASSFQDTGENGTGQNVVISDVDIINSRLAVYDASANAHLQNLDTNANLENDFLSLITTPVTKSAGDFVGVQSMGEGIFRYRNAVFMGVFDITVDTDPQVVFQFSQDGTNWFSDGIQPSLFDPAPPSNIREFCIQRSNVPTLYIRLYFITQSTVNSLQLVLTKN